MNGLVPGIGRRIKEQNKRCSERPQVSATVLQGTKGRLGSRFSPVPLDSIQKPTDSPYTHMLAYP